MGISPKLLNKIIGNRDGISQNLIGINNNPRRVLYQIKLNLNLVDGSKELNRFDHFQLITLLFILILVGFEEYLSA